MWLWNRFRPIEGWLAFFLVGGAVASVVLGVLEVGWVPEDGVVIPTAMFGLILGVVLAKRPLRYLPAWILITLYGLLFTIFDLAQLWPTYTAISNDNLPFGQFWRQNSALFYDRVASWFKAVLSGGSSRETIVFAIGLGLLAWFLAAYSGWSTFRQHKPLHGLTMMGMALALNGYFGNAAIYWLAIFVGLATVLTAVLHYTHMEQEWQANEVDYSDEVRLELILYATIISIILLTFSATIPAINFKELVRRYTGKGWTLSEERQEPTQANERIPLPQISEPLQLSQSVNWEFDERVIRYTLGLPLQFDQSVTVNWRGLEDLSRVQGEESTYRVITQISNATPDELRSRS